MCVITVIELNFSASFYRSIAVVSTCFVWRYVMHEYSPALWLQPVSMHGELSLICHVIVNFYVTHGERILFIILLDIFQLSFRIEVKYIYISRGELQSK